MVVTHSRKSVLISGKSQAPASAGAGRGMNLHRVSEMSCFEDEVEAAFSVWGSRTDVSWPDWSSSKTEMTDYLHVGNCLKAYLFPQYNRWYVFSWAVSSVTLLKRGGGFFNRAHSVLPLVTPLHSSNANTYRLFQLQQRILLLHCGKKRGNNNRMKRISTDNNRSNLSENLHIFVWGWIFVTRL